MKPVIQKAIAILTAILLAGTTAASAVELEEQGLEAEPGGFAYGLQRIAENVRYTFTFNPASRAEYATKLSERRLAEANATNNTQTRQRLLEDYENRVSQIATSLADVDDDERRVRVEALVSEATSRHEAVLEQIRSRTPRQARSGLDRALNASRTVRSQAAEIISMNESQRSDYVASQRNQTRTDVQDNIPTNTQVNRYGN